MYRVSTDGRFDAEILFTLPLGVSAIGLAAGPDAVYVVTAAVTGSVWSFSISSHKLSQTQFGVGRLPVGIALGGDRIYAATVGEGHPRLEYTSALGSKPWKWWELESPEMGSPAGTLFDAADNRVPTSDPVASKLVAMPAVFDAVGNRVLICDPVASKLVAISSVDGSKKVLSSSVGAATSLAANKSGVFVGSGGKVLFLSRVTGKGENPPQAVQSLKLKSVSGLVIDQAGDLWVSDSDSKLIKGPIFLR